MSQENQESGSEQSQKDRGCATATKPEDVAKIKKVEEEAYTIESTVEVDSDCCG